MTGSPVAAFPTGVAEWADATVRTLAVIQRWRGDVEREAAFWRDSDASTLAEAAERRAVALREEEIRIACEIVELVDVGGQAERWLELRELSLNPPHHWRSHACLVIGAFTRRAENRCKSTGRSSSKSQTAPGLRKPACSRRRSTTRRSSTTRRTP